MGLIELLMWEHRRIERGLDALQAWASVIAGPEGAAAQPDGSKFVRFLREFADTHHHGKEEQMLFIAMQDAGMPLEMGPIAVMLHEHDEGRAWVAQLDAASVSPSPWPPEVVQSAAQAAQMFASLLRAHIQKEDNVLYPMAQRMLDAEDMAELDADAEAHEEEHGAQRAQLELLAAELAQRYLA